MMISSLLSLVWLTAQPAPPAPAPDAAAPKALSISWSGALELSALTAIDEALDKPLGNTWSVLVADKPPRSIKTCRELLAVSKVKFDLPPDQQSDVDWAGLVSDSIRCFALEALKGAKVPAASHLGWFRFSQAGVARLPPTFGMSIAENDQTTMEKAAKRCQPWGKYDRRLKLKVDAPDSGHISADGWAGRLTLYGRADFDGDGLEDLLFLRYGKLKDGAQDDEALFIVTQTSPQACPRVIRTLPDGLGSGEAHR
jgi:hypothetical protein